ncbi:MULTISPECIES: anti sigma factor C-terminal domain-containing protein [Lawsonibacter]|uniref:anti sigma factor C-terminal domain-containing protein n=1 Tax=Lawsonibacter TaxID=2172004 RepID=UPI00258E1AEB|nr:anti sigma factor C-terminal domain-containing protein [Lawsonibacter sp.]MCI6398662.1 anti-sigma factor C-terminal domain-containing protein [Lawsonibacter sp.]
MSFRELLERYRTGAATEAERALVEAELEKSAAISDYLAEGLEAELTGEGAHRTSEETEPARRVRRIVNRRLGRVAVLSAAVVLAVLLGVRLVVSPLAASFCYQPNARSVGQAGDEREDIWYDLNAFYELIMPGRSVRDIQTGNRGFGRYDLSYTEEDWLTGERTAVSRTLEPGQDGENGYLWSEQAIGLYALAESGAVEEGVRRIPDYEADLAQLDESAYVSVWVHFPQDLTPMEFAALAHGYEQRYGVEISFRWCAVRTSDDPAVLRGFSTVDGSCAQGGLADYPMLSLAERLGNWFPSGSAAAMAKAYGGLYTQHFQSLLSYAAERTKAADALVGPGAQFPEYDFAGQRDYVEEHGIRIYGALVYGQPQALLALTERGDADGLAIERVLACRYSGSRSIRQ